MSVHLSHVTRGRVSDRRAKQINRVLVKHNAELVRYTDPGSGPSVWIESPNQGFPFDRDRERAMQAALDEAGLWPLVPEK